MFALLLSGRVEIEFEAGAQAIGGELAGRFSAKAQGLGNGPSEQRIAERAENQCQCRLGDLVVLVSGRELGYEIVDRFQDRVQGITVAGEDHPRGKSAGTFAVEGIKGHVHDIARVGLAGPSALHGFGDALRHTIGDGARKFPLETGSGAEMVEEVGVRPSDFGSNRF